MKKYLLLAFVLIAIHAKAQIWIGDDKTREIMTIKTDTMSVARSFELLEKLCKGKMWAFDRCVIYNGQRFYQFGVVFKKNRKTYYREGNKLRRIHV